MILKSQVKPHQTRFALFHLYCFSLLNESSSESVREILVGGVQSEDSDLVQMLMEKVTCQETIQAAVTKLPVEAVIPTLKVILSNLEKG